MLSKTFTNNLVGRLPKTRGSYRANYELAPATWFRVGGPAEIFFKPEDYDDLVFFLKERPADVAYTMVGVASNLLVRDGGVPGVVIRLGKGFTHIAFNGDYVDVGAGVLDRTLAEVAADEGMTGLEFLCGIPGTIGGALRMNAGCYGREIKDVLISAFVLDPKGQLHTLTPTDLGYTYRHCGLPADWIFVGARFRVEAGNPSQIHEYMASLLAEREKTQPVKSRTGGSTFANPEGYKAWQLIDKAGCRGMRRGGAMVSELHCNFLINAGNATADDLEMLGETIRQKVAETSQVDLRWEVERVGISLVTKAGMKEAA